MWAARMPNAVGVLDGWAEMMPLPSGLQGCPKSACASYDMLMSAELLLLEQQSEQLLCIQPVITLALSYVKSLEVLSPSSHACYNSYVGPFS